MPTVLITGANRGIGLEFARQYAAQGWDVIATARESSAELESLGVRIDKLDLLVANAGTYGPRQVESAEQGEGWAETFVVNSIAPFLIARSVVEQVARNRGKLIAISTRMGSIADNDSGGFIAYRSSKAALNAAWRSLAIDTKGRGIVAAVLHPGWVQTRMGGQSAPLRPDESVAGMRQVIERLGPAQSGGFFSHDGSEIPW
jgi:NAD(P)-dependent dehydrogenase (short-subunit alcohol dehydrogenase family)